jgi:carbamoyl-phosphate synthase large subunit
MTREFNILFTSSGRRVSLIRQFRAALHSLNLDGKLITADRKSNAPTAFVSDYHEIVPSVSDPSYVDYLLSLCKKHRIKLLVPLIDTELTVLSRNKTRFEANGVTVLVSSEETNEICFDKRNTYEFFRVIGVKYPRVFSREDLEIGSYQFPLFIKPAKGSSSIGTAVIHDRTELDFFLHHVEEPIVQELVIGDEYTVDVFADFDGRVLTAVPRRRLETRSGEVSKGVTVRHSGIIEQAEFVVSHLPKPFGCVTLQCFLTQNGDIVFIEINPRFGGGIPLTIESGANFPRAVVRMVLGQDPQSDLNHWRDGLAMLRYDDAIFVDAREIK